MRTQFENLQPLIPPADMHVDTYPIVPFRERGLIERLPLLQTSQKGTLRSTLRALPLLRSHYDAAWSQVLLPLIPLLAAGDAHLVQLPAIVYAIDTTPLLMDTFSEIYYGVPGADRKKRLLRDALFRYALRRCALIAPWSQWAARSFIEQYGVPEERIKVLPPGVDLAAWAVPERRLVPIEPVRASPFQILFVGADFVRKGGPLLLDVFRRHLQDRCELHLVTRAAIPEEPGVRVYRDFGPNQQGLRELYTQSDALVLPTRADCYSLAAIEAMACGLPVIISPVGGIPEIVCHNRTGLLVRPNDGRGLLEAIESLLHQPARARALGLAGRGRAEERFDNGRNSHSLFTLLRELGTRDRTPGVDRHKGDSMKKL